MNERDELKKMISTNRMHVEIEFLRAQLEAVTQERDAALKRTERGEVWNEMVELRKLLQKSLAAQARMRKTLEWLQVGFAGMWGSPGKVWYEEALEQAPSGIEDALSSDDGSELLAAIRGAIEVIQMLLVRETADFDHDPQTCGQPSCVLGKQVLQALRKALGEGV